MQVLRSTLLPVVSPIFTVQLQERPGLLIHQKGAKDYCLPMRRSFDECKSVALVRAELVWP